MIPKECKRLAEVDFPIAEVSRHAAREKSIRHGHPSTLHIWWARRPLASSRAVLMTLLLPDPCDPYCPNEFKVKARETLLAMRGRASGWDSTVKTDEGLRQVLIRFIADFANWDNCAKSEYLETGRGLVKAAHPEETPLVVDPFAGGGSIPLEALRLGCETFASDLNPVACLILKVMLEDIPRHGLGLADELRKAGAEIKVQAEKELADLYPKDSDRATPIAYLWARTVRCEAPNCGTEIPIYRSAWLSKKGARRARYFKETDGGSCVALLVKTANPGEPVEFRIVRGEGRETPAPKFTEIRGTKARGNNANVICPCCRVILSGTQKSPRVSEQLSGQRGGTDVTFDAEGHRSGGARLLAVVVSKSGQQGHAYRLPTDTDYIAIRKAQQRVAEIMDQWEQDGANYPSPIPNETINPVRPSPNARGLSPVTRYGMNNFGDLFTARQKAALAVLAKIVNDRYSENEGFLYSAVGLAISKQAERLSCLVSWITSTQAPRGTFSRQALGMVWDFLELVPIVENEEFPELIDAMVRAIEFWARAQPNHGQVQPADATKYPLPDQSAGVWFTDPPYYDSIPYADLSDFFLVWLNRSLQRHPLLQDPFDTKNRLSPKLQECVWNQSYEYQGQPKDAKFFEAKIAQAFKEGRRILIDGGIGSVVFAHKSTEAWEVLLSGITAGGWTITGSWPIATERGARPNARDTASLATSVHLVCRPRPEDAPIGEWADVLRELPVRVGDWMERLQGEGVRGADLVFACIGPALEIYSRYSRVETPEGHQVGLPEYLERVWEVVGREALEQVLGTPEAQARNGAAGALEEDARLTALFLWTLQATDDNAVGDTTDEADDGDGTPQNQAPGFSLPFDVTRRFAQPLGIHLEDWESRIIKTEKGVVRLRPVTERAKDLFGDSGADALADEIETSAAASAQLSLFPEAAPTVRGRSRRRGQTPTNTADGLETNREATTLDRVHAAMLLQASGRTEALRNLLRAEQDRGPDFLRLANALSALYPRGSEEKRLLDGMLLAVPR